MEMGFSQRSIGKSQQPQVAITKFQLNMRRKKITTGIILAQGLGINSLGNAQNSVRQGPEQPDTTLKLGLI